MLYSFVAPSFFTSVTKTGPNVSKRQQHVINPTYGCSRDIFQSFNGVSSSGFATNLNKFWELTFCVVDAA